MAASRAAADGGIDLAQLVLQPAQLLDLGHHGRIGFGERGLGGVELAVEVGAGTQPARRCVGRRSWVVGGGAEVERWSPVVRGRSVVCRSCSSVGRCDWSSRFPSRSSSIRRPRAIRDLTVPIGTPRRLGDLGVVEVTDVAHHDRHAELLGQIGEGGVDRDPVDDALDLALGELVGRARGAAATSVGVVADDVQLRPAARACGARRGRRWWRCDSVQVANEERPSKRSIDAHDPDQRLLGGVVGVAGGAGDPAAHGVDAVVVAAQQGIERVAVAALGGNDEVLVGWRR